jgi:hypothetical protein
MILVSITFSILVGAQRAMLGVALSFFTWRVLVRDGGLTQRAAVAAMVRAIECN